MRFKRARRLGDIRGDQGFQGFFSRRGRRRGLLGVMEGSTVVLDGQRVSSVVSEVSGLGFEAPGLGVTHDRSVSVSQMKAIGVSVSVASGGSSIGGVSEIVSGSVSSLAGSGSGVTSVTLEGVSCEVSQSGVELVAAAVALPEGVVTVEAGGLADPRVQQDLVTVLADPEAVSGLDSGASSINAVVGSDSTVGISNSDVVGSVLPVSVPGPITSDQGLATEVGSDSGLNADWGGCSPQVLPLCGSTKAFSFNTRFNNLARGR